MGWAITLLSVALAIVFVGHALLGALFVRRCQKGSGTLADRDCPRTAVILCLRGEDPTLHRCLQCLFQQDHPNYEVMIVVDREDDPAWRTVRQFMRHSENHKTHLRVLTERQATCSLKCSAIVQAIRELEETSEFDVYALLDQDVVPHASWLRELVAPLTQKGVAASSGFRWFIPERLTFASVLRTQWNAASVPLMCLNGICWGGSLALRSDFVRDGDLLDKWSRAISDDTMIRGVAAGVGRSVAFLPSLLMVNRGEANPNSLLPWIIRQTYFGFLHNPSFKWRNRIATTFYVFLLSGSAVVGGASLVAGRQGGWPLLAMLFAYSCLLVHFHWRLDRLAVGQAADDQRSQRPHPFAWILAMFICLPISQAISLLAVHATWGRKRIQWRGVGYRVDGAFRVVMEDEDRTETLPAPRQGVSSATDASDRAIP